MTSRPRFNCGIDAAMSVIEGRWKCTILCLLAKNGEMRFSDILKTIGVISTRMLSRQLKELETDGMIRKTASSKTAVYGLTQKGESIIPALAELAKWGVDNVFTNIVTIDVQADRNTAE